MAVAGVAWIDGAAADPPKVVATIKPIHSLIAGVMEGVGVPDLLLDGPASPHAYALKPSDARKLAAAEVVFWVDKGLEAFLAKALGALAPKARVVALSEEPGVALLDAREGGAWEEHEDEHEKKHGDSRAHEPESGKATALAPESQGHGHSAVDMHIWLDPENAKAIVGAAVATLAAVDPANASRYRANGARLAARLDALDRALGVRLATLRDRPYVVFHDAYQYFERRYDLNAIGSITVSPERSPGAKRLSELRGKILDLKAACVFSEPQFEPKLVGTIVAGTGARTGVLDPLGAALSPGPDSYFLLMEGLARGLADCLAGPRQK
ncbi:MAG: zinc ABC transporter substrate-binding protein [Proteobacteria bacterium]|nr:zinc ABC transporter substrate-binding protein [Pseudomonadota bacterium]